MTVGQRFKENDPIEGKMVAAANALIESIRADLDAFHGQAFETYSLGDVLYLGNRDPMVGKILPEFYRESYPAIHDMFTSPATFEFFIELIRAIWGDSVPIEFVRPSPGVLNINIESQEVTLSIFHARKIVDDVYVYEAVAAQPDMELIAFQTSKGIKTQADADLLCEEVSATGYVTRMNLIFD